MHVWNDFASANPASLEKCDKTTIPEKNGQQRFDLHADYILLVVKVYDRSKIS